MNSSLLIYVVLGFLVLRLLLPFIISVTSPLRSVPGPFWARFTRLWYFSKVGKGDFEKINFEVHRQYGSVVRIAPDHYSIDDPSAIKTIYGINSKFAKSDWYEGWKHPRPDRWTLFPDRNIERHAQTRRLFQGMYSLSSLVTYESYVDDCTEIFCERLAEFAKSGEMINMGHWFQCYAFDVIGEITYSKRFGFLDKGEDVGGTLAALQKSMVFSTLGGIYASWYPLLYYTLERVAPQSGPAGRTFIMNFVNQQLTDRKKSTTEPQTDKLETSGPEDGSEMDSANMPEDFLSKIMKARQEKPDQVTEYHCFMMGLSNIIAGSDTTAISLSSILYYLSRYPETLQKLRAEIEDFESADKLGKDTVRFNEAQEMPYFQAVMKEALRLHPPAGLPLWRVVPEGGSEISGRYFPAGTVVGVSGWVAHFNEDVFGGDAMTFRPERWIEAKAQGGDLLKRMEAYYFPVSYELLTPDNKSLTVFFSVRSRVTNLHWKTHLFPRDVEVDSSNC